MQIIKTNLTWESEPDLSTEEYPYFILSHRRLTSCICEVLTAEGASKQRVQKTNIRRARLSVGNTCTVLSGSQSRRCSVESEVRRDAVFAWAWGNIGIRCFDFALRKNPGR